MAPKRQASISVDPSVTPHRQFTELPCAPGDYRLALAPNGSGHAFQPQIFDYTVFGADRVEPKFVKRRLLEEIDLTATPPDFASGETSVESERDRIVSRYGKPWLHRVSASPGGQRDNLSPPGWFAYRLTPPALRRPYILEVEYPDNATRTFLVAIRAPDRPPYPSPSRLALSGHCRRKWPEARRCSGLQAPICASLS